MREARTLLRLTFMRRYTKNQVYSHLVKPRIRLPMSPRLFAFVSSLFMSPALLSAAEPGKGTVITIASIGGWVIFSSTGLMLRRQRDKNAAEAAQDADKPAEPSNPR